MRALLGLFPVAMDPLSSVVAKCCFACVRALLDPFPVTDFYDQAIFCSQLQNYCGCSKACLGALISKALQLRNTETVQRRCCDELGQDGADPYPSPSPSHIPAQLMYMI